MRVTKRVGPICAKAAAKYVRPTGSASECAEAASGDDVRAALRRTVASVAVVTAGGEAGPVGYTASSVASVSLAPPTVVFGVGTSGSSWPVIRGARCVGVHFLRADQEWIARRFSGRVADRFGAPLDWHPGPDGVPMLRGTLFSLVCRVDRAIALTDANALVVGTVLVIEAGAGGRSLTYGDGRFASAGRPTPSPDDPAAVDAFDGGTGI
jgi:flavin reductase (DIM6/NTAB) family NADH-FMN oxidoreductase RutF